MKAFQLSSKNENVGKHIHHCVLDDLPVLTGFSDETDRDIIEYGIFDNYDEIYP